MTWYSVSDKFSLFPDVFDVGDLLRAAGFFTNEQAAQGLDVTVRTVQRWKKENRLPRAVFLALRYLAGDLTEARGGQWRGWTLYDNAIFTDDGRQYTLFQVRRIGWLEYHVERKLIDKRHAQGEKEGKPPGVAVLLKTTPLK